MPKTKTERPLKRMPLDVIRRYTKGATDSFMDAIRARLIEDGYCHGDDFRTMMYRVGQSMLARSKKEREPAPPEDDEVGAAQD